MTDNAANKEEVEEDIPEVVSDEPTSFILGEVGKSLTEVGAGSAPAAGYGSIPSSAPAKTSLRGHWNRAKSVRVAGGWSRLKRDVESDSFIIRASSHNWSDAVNFQYDFSLRECFLVFLAFLAIGALSFSYVFEHWSLLDSLYFTVVLLTTVGYGDITPTSVGGKLFASAFGFVGIAIFGLVLGVLGSQLVEAKIKDFDQERSEVSKVMESAFATSSSEEKAQAEQGIEVGNSGVEEDLQEFVSGLKVIIRILEAFALIILFMPVMLAIVEQWGLIDGIYCGIVTATTIGFGDFTPTTLLGKGLAILLIPLDVGAMGYIMGKLATKIVDRRQRERINAQWSKAKDFTTADIDALDESGDGAVSESEYIKYMLVAMQKVDKALIDELQKQFRELDVTGDGLITKEDLKKKRAKALNKWEWSYYEATAEAGREYGGVKHET